MEDHRAPVRVALADPVPGGRASLRHLVESIWGWQVTGEAADGFEAVRVARSTSPDVLLVDGAIEGLRLPEIRELLAATATVVVALLDRPEQHAASNGPAVLKSVPTESLKSVVMTELRASVETPAETLVDRPVAR